MGTGRYGRSRMEDGMGWDWDHDAAAWLYLRRAAEEEWDQVSCYSSVGLGREPKAGMSVMNMLGPGGAGTDARGWEGRKVHAWQGLGLRSGITMCQRLCPKRRKACGTSPGQCKKPRA